MHIVAYISKYIKWKISFINLYLLAYEIVEFI